jgi:hypothetical protein
MVKRANLRRTPQHFPKVCTGSAPFYTSDPQCCAQQTRYEVFFPEKSVPLMEARKIIAGRGGPRRGVRGQDGARSATSCTDCWTRDQGERDADRPFLAGDVASKGCLRRVWRRDAAAQGLMTEDEVRPVMMLAAASWNRGMSP